MRDGQTEKQVRRERIGADRHGESRTQPGEDRVEPHAVASELTADRSVAASAGQVDVSDPAVTRTNRQPGDQPPRDQAVTRAQKDIGRTMMAICGLSLLVALVLASVFFRNWMIFGLGLIVIIPFMIMVMAPFWLASTTKTAQDHTVRQQRNRDQSSQGNGRSN